MSQASNSVRTGEYIINYFNFYGARLKDLEKTASSLMMANDLGENSLFDPKEMTSGEDKHILPISYVVDRRITNSLDNATVRSVPENEP